MMPSHSDFAVIPDELAFEVCQREHRDMYDECIKRVQWIMGWMPSKATEWMAAKNPMLGGVSPVSMIVHGRGIRLDRFIAESEAVQTGARKW
jgi:hypothetical protein